MIRAAIIGATGYTALELIKILLRHPGVEITTLTSRSEGSPHVGSVHPQLAGRVDLSMADIGPVEIASRADALSNVSSDAATLSPEDPNPKDVSGFRHYDRSSHSDMSDWEQVAVRKGRVEISSLFPYELPAAQKLVRRMVRLEAFKLQVEFHIAVVLPVEAHQRGANSDAADRFLCSADIIERDQ